MLYCYLCCSVIIELPDVLIVCTVPLPPGVNPIAVDKYIYININIIYEAFLGVGIFLHYDSVGSTGTLLRNVLPTLLNLNPEDGGSKYTRNVFVILQGT
jgi:hypothetical protein